MNTMKYFINADEVNDLKNTVLWVYKGDESDLIIPPNLTEVNIVVNMFLECEDLSLHSTTRWEIPEAFLSADHIFNRTEEGNEWYLLPDFNILSPEVYELSYISDSIGVKLPVTYFAGGSVNKVKGDEIDNIDVVINYTIESDDEMCDVDDSIDVTGVSNTTTKEHYLYYISSVNKSLIPVYAKHILNRAVETPAELLIKY